MAAAPLVNIGVDLAEHPAIAGIWDWRSVPSNLGHQVLLLRSLNTGYLEVIKPADQVLMQSRQVNTVTYAGPRWIFNDVDVSAAENPANKYYFAVQVDGIPTHTTIWAHGADPRTVFPERDVPVQSAEACR